MDTYYADAMHAGKNMVIEAGTNAGEAQVTESQLILSGGLWGRLREMHGFLKSVVGGSDSRRVATSLACSCTYTAQTGPRSSLLPLKHFCVTQGICTCCALCPE